MRHSNHAGRASRLSILAVGVFAMIVVGCGPAAVASVPSLPPPTPVVTPDPHLFEPVTADQIFLALAKAKLGLVTTNANLGNGNPDIVKQINADIGSWPLRITQYRSSAALTRALGWKSGEAPGRNETPYAFAGLNVLVEFGPTATAGAPKPPPAGRQEAAATIVAVLDPLLWPLAQHSVVPIPGRTAEPVATPAPSVASSARPTAKPKPTARPKPSKAP
jgi:hypothetical protein